MVARAAALRTNINTDGRPLPTKKRRRTSSKHCAPHLLHVAMSTSADTPFRSFVQTQIFSVSPSSFSLQQI